MSLSFYIGVVDERKRDAPSLQYILKHVNSKLGCQDTRVTASRYQSIYVLTVLTQPMIRKMCEGLYVYGCEELIYK